MFEINWNKKNFTNYDIFYNEIVNFFSPSNFIGLKQLVNDRNFYVVDFLSERYIITKTDKYNLLNNSCLHKNAKLISSEKDVKKDKLICPVHFWTYDLDGKLLVAPCSNFDCKSKNLSIKSKKEIFEYEMFLFSSESLADELKKSKFLKDFDFSKYEILEKNSYEQRGNWKEYGIVFNDSNHIKFFHPEMNEVIDETSIEWEFGVDYSAHRLKFSSNWENKKNNRFTEYFKKLKSLGFSIKNDGVNDYAVTWLNIFPNVFIDLWAQQINIVYVEPISLDRYMIHNFWLCDKDLFEESEINKLFLDAMNDVENEDNDIINKIHQGMIGNYESEIFTEYIISPLENGDIDFHKWLMKNGEFYIK